MLFNVATWKGMEDAPCGSYEQLLMMDKFTLVVSLQMQFVVCYD